MFRCPNHAGLGASWQDQLMAGLMAGAEKADPELGEIVRLAREIIALERRPGGALDPRTPSTFRISDLRAPLKGYLFYRRNQLLVQAIPFVVLGLAFLLGRVTK